MIIGYARDSGPDRAIGSQWQKLVDAGCDRVFADPKGAGRRGLNEALDVLTADDELLIVDIVALGKSSKDVLGALEKAYEKGANIRSIDETLDTTYVTETNALITTLLSPPEDSNQDRAQDPAQYGAHPLQPLLDLRAARERSISLQPPWTPPPGVDKAVLAWERMALLDTLADRGGESNFATLQAYLGVGSSSIKNHLVTLEKADLIRREKRYNKGRETRVFLTHKGFKTLHHLAAQMGEFDRRDKRRQRRSRRRGA